MAKPSKQMNKESILNQVEIAEGNINRFKILVEADLIHIPDFKVAIYCLTKTRLQIENLEREFIEYETTKNPPTTILKPKI